MYSDLMVHDMTHSPTYQDTGGWVDEELNGKGNGWGHSTSKEQRQHADQSARKRKRHSFEWNNAPTK